MKLKTLDLDTLRTLVMASDLGGYVQAAAALGRTPSAVSLQMKRLQHSAQTVLFRKRGRGVSLTDAGEVVLRYARQMINLNDELLHAIRGTSLEHRVRLGVSPDFAQTLLPSVLDEFAKLYPRVRVEVRIEGKTALIEAVEQEELDLALAIGHGDRTSGEILGELELVWIARPELTYRRGEPLPLVVFGPHCGIRKDVIRKLDQAGISWRIAAESPSLSGLWASASGGLGVTAHSRLGVPGNLIGAPRLFDLPRLKSLAITLHGPSHVADPSLQHLRALMTRAVTEVLPEANSAPRTYAQSPRSLPFQIQNGAQVARTIGEAKAPAANPTLLRRK
jgi:DNA-binding transcriptional LysR family regulator